MDKDILFLLAIRKRELEVTINNQYTHGDLILSSVCEKEARKGSYYITGDERG